MAEFSDRIKELRAENDYTMDYVVNCINKKHGTRLTRSHISRYERGETSPSITIFSYFCEFYNVSADYLLGLVDDPQGKYGTPYVPPVALGEPGRHRRVVVRAARMKSNRKKIGGAS